MKNPPGRSTQEDSPQKDSPPIKTQEDSPKKTPPKTPPGSLHSSSSGKRTQGLEAFVLNETVNFPMDLETICLWPGKSQVNMSRVKWEAQSSDQPKTASNAAGFTDVREWTLERLKPPFQDTLPSVSVTLLPKGHRTKQWEPVQVTSNFRCSPFPQNRKNQK